MKLQAIDLFCGAGGASLGLFRAGYEVVGVDISPQPNYPFNFIKMDVLDAPIDCLRSYDLIWASPPCQFYSLSQRIQDNDHPDLIDTVRERLIASGKPYVIENVIGAPLRKPIELCGAMFGLKTYRHRRFETSFPCKQPWHQAHELIAPQTKMGRALRDGEFIQVTGNFSGIERAKEAMGIDWMTRDEIREAIPPIFSEYIALHSVPQNRNRSENLIIFPNLTHHNLTPVR